MSEDFARFVRPRRVALVGATEDTSKFGGRVFRQLLGFGFDGDIYPVNPRAETLRGLPCFKSVRDLPERPDHVGIVVPAEHVLSVLEDCAAVGVPYATIFTSGFAELGTEEGHSRQRKLKQVAQSTGIRFMGPNCNGMVNFVDGFACTTTNSISGPRRKPGHVGLVAHSGGLGQVNVMWRAQQAGVEISYQFSCGNDGDLDALDLAEFMVRDSATDVIMLVLEKVASGAKLASLAQLALDARKPIVAVKIGRSEVGARAAASHTGAVTGSDAVHDAAFRQYGILRVDDVSELYEAALFLKTKRFPQGSRLAAVSISGGSLAMFSDLSGLFGFQWPAYSDATQAALKAVLSSPQALANPSDLTTSIVGRSDGFQKVLQIIADDENIDVLVPIVTFCSEADIAAIVAVAQSTSKPLAVLWTGGCRDNPALTTAAFTDHGVPVYRDMTPCLKAIESGVRFGRYLARAKHREERPNPQPEGMDAARARELLRRAGPILTERQSKAILACYGFPVLPERLATTSVDAIGIAAEFDGPVAMKIESPDIPHKTEANAVRLNVQGEAQVTRAFDAIMEAARAYAPGAALAGVLIQKMATPGLEMVLGLSTDPVFGPVLTAGLGGIFMEVLQDVSHRIPPIDHTEARDMLMSLKCAALLGDFRGRAARDVERLCDLLVRLSWMAVDLVGEIAELDLNPVVLLARGEGVEILDALIVRAPMARRQA